jgi:hypothetical protein
MTSRFYSFDEDAREFLFSIMSHYQGTTEERIKRAAEFIDDLIFKTENDLKNPFSNDSRKYYKLARYSKRVLIPEILTALKILNDSDPFNIHEWN